MNPPEPDADRDLAAVLADLEEIPAGADLEAVAAEADRIARAAERSGDTALQLRAQLVQADIWERTGRTGAAARLMWEVNRWAAQHDCRPLLARSHHLLARVYHHLGDTAASLEHFVSCLEFVGEETRPHARVTLLMRLADALATAGAFDDARQHYAQAEQLAVEISNVERQLSVLNNLAYTEYEANEPDRAWAAVQRLREVSAQHGRAPDIKMLDSIARIEISIGRYREAVATIRQCLRKFHAEGEEDCAALAEILLTLATAQRCDGALDEAQAALDECLALCERAELSDARARVRQEQAALYAARGEYRRAYQEQVAFHADHELVRARQREAQTSTRLAMYETAEARRDAERFREQAYRDPLTGLANRRHVDEHLPVLLRDADSAVSLALLDLDHFKRVNDTCSHEVGDRVLTTVAGTLARQAAEVGDGAFAVRLGGEEFLIVMPATPADVAARHMERLLARIREYDWAPVTGAVPVTASIGLVCAQPGSVRTQAELLAVADRNLYLAKRAGRDRLIGEPAVKSVFPGGPSPVGSRRVHSTP